MPNMFKPRYDEVAYNVKTLLLKLWLFEVSIFVTHQYRKQIELTSVYPIIRYINVQLAMLT